MSFLLSKNISKHQNEGLVENRQAILESATRLFGSTGFDAITTLEIAAEADVTESLIYHHFKGKDELFILVIRVHPCPQNGNSNTLNIGALKRIGSKKTGYREMTG